MEQAEKLECNIERVFEDVELTRRLVQDFLEQQTEESARQLAPGVITMAMVVKMNMEHASRRLAGMGHKPPVFILDQE